MNLLATLKGVGAVTGPLINGNTSHSNLDVIKKYLLGQRQFTGGESFLGFGNYLHLAFAGYPQVQVFAVSREDAEKLSAMVEKLYGNKLVLALVKDSIREQKFYEVINGCKVAMILDVKHPGLKRGADLKTTSCKTFADFLKKAILYGYFRQALIYMIGAGLKEFYFIGICKESPFEVFILNVKDYPKELKYAEEELKFLLYFYNNYGKIILPK